MSELTQADLSKFCDKMVELQYRIKDLKGQLQEAQQNAAMECGHARRFLQKEETKCSECDLIAALASERDHHQRVAAKMADRITGYAEKIAALEQKVKELSR